MIYHKCFYPNFKRFAEIFQNWEGGGGCNLWVREKGRAFLFTLPNHIFKFNMAVQCVIQSKI